LAMDRRARAWPTGLSEAAASFAAWRASPEPVR
jgi:hypothetical protein